MIRRWPSTTWVSLVNACMLSRVRALAALALAFACCFFVAVASSSLKIRSTGTWAYQTSRLRAAANSCIRARYSATPAMTTARRSAGLNPRSRPAISKLAASRLTSHSHGPGRVSSKSLMSNIICRSGEANTPKLDRWASPQIWALRPERGVAARSEAMISAPPR